MPNAAIHPTQQELAAFALGKLPDDASAAVARHLEKCPACRKAIENLPGDSFLGKVRAAKPNVSSLPARPATAAAPSAPPKDLPPDLAHYAKYRFLRELGRGGMGVVYQAEQTVMGRTVAVKVINPSVLAHPDALPRFQGEVKAAARLDHPNIVRAYDAEQVGSMHLLVMEYVEGTSLADLVAKKGPQPVAYACHYVRQAALGLQHAFEQGMVHRDIKPQNLMVNARGQVKVLDFGLARMRSERKAGGGLTQADAFMGTPEYVAPEQATDARSADTRADIYSLGCTLFFLLTGRPPFQAETMVKLILAQIEQEPPALQEVRADVPAELSAVVARMLAKDPARRFQTPIEVAQALAAFVKAGPKGATGVSSPASGVSSPGTGTVIAADTSKIKAVLREVPGKAPAQNAPAKAEAGSVFAGLGESVASAKKQGKPARKAAKPALTAWWKRPRVVAGAIGVSLVLILMAVIIIKVKVQPPDSDPGKTKPPPAEAIVVLEIDQPGAEVMVDGQKISVHVPGDNKPIEIKVEPGRPHKLRIRKDGFEVVTRDVELQSGKSAPIHVRLEKLPEPIPPAPPLPPEKQVEAVAQKLRDLNPGFDGKWARAPGIEGDKIVSLVIQSDHMRDLTPLQDLPHLRRLDLLGTKVTDLTPLQSLPLTFLYLAYSGVSDLSPLRGMKELEHLNFTVAPPLTDLKPLEGLKLRGLTVYATRVEDLSPLKGMPLKYLNIGKTRVKDLSPLKGMELDTFIYNEGTPVKDIAVLKEMPLRLVTCDFRRERDEAVLRSIKTLETINGKPAAQFWKEVDSTKTSDRSPTEEKGPSTDKGFVPLFNGKDTKGWKTNPEGEGAWKVENGVLIWSSLDFSSLRTERNDYRDFHLRFETRISDRHYAQIGVRGGYVVVLNSTNGNPRKTGSFGVVGGGTGVMVSKSLVPPDHWFTLEVIAEGNHFVVKVNGKTTADYSDPARRFASGNITLNSGNREREGQRHLDFRKIEIKELPPPKRDDQGFVPLFNGKDTKGWKTHGSQRGKWRVEKGVLIGYGPDISHLYTERGDYQDFNLRMESRINDGGNSGLYFRTEFGLGFPLGYEAQISSIHGPKIKTGSLNPNFNPKLTKEQRDKLIVRDMLVKPEEWFTQEVIARGNHIIIKVNGKTTVDFVDENNTYTKGHFAIKYPGTVVKFRKIEIKELPAK